MLVFINDCLLVGLTGEGSVISNCNFHGVFNDGIRKYGDMNCPQGKPQVAPSTFITF